MKKYLFIVFIASLVYTGCDLIDGTNVRNPDVTLDAATEQANSATSWLNGVERRAAILYNDILPTAELTTDNYVNVATYFNQNVDAGTIRDSDTDIENANFQVHRLREQAKFGLTEVIPNNDPAAAGTEVEAELYFYKGWSHLMAAELFVALPAEPQGPAVSPAAHYDSARVAFETANSIAADISYDAALARVHYGLGNQTEAVQYAEAVLDADEEFVRFVEYDGVNGPTNTMESALYDRGSFDDLQPLPRLDFLDPKYGDLGGTDESPIAILKSEEMYLIVAEAQMNDGTLPLAQATLLDLLDLVDNRETRVVDETVEGRIGPEDDGLQRPDTSAYAVRASANDAFVDSLVLDRTATTEVPSISGTSVTEADVLAALADGTDALELLYLLRQEIFMAEGRRMFDLGVRWPVSQVEGLRNDDITQEDRTAHIPSYIPTPYASIDAYEDSRVVDGEFDPTIDTYEVTIQHNLNRILATEKGNQFGS